jgi:hypothetical protein
VALSKTAQALREAARKTEIESMEGGPPIPPEPPSAFEAISSDIPLDDMPGTQFATETAGDPLERRRTSRHAARAERQAERWAKQREKRGNVGLAILGAIGIVAIGNACMLTIAIPTNFWEFWETGWPIQIFLASWGLCAIMYIASSIWMLIPIGPVFVSGVLLAYSEITGNWDHWDFFGLIEAWVVIISVCTPIFLSGNKRFARVLSRLFAILLSLASIASIIFVSLGIGLGSLVVDWGNVIMP